MTYCKDFAPLLSAFVDGELSAAERETLLAHLNECEGCRDYLCELEAMHAAFGELEEAEVPEGFAAAVLERARQDARGAKKVSRRRRFAPLAACAALFVFVSVTTLPWINAMGKSAAEEAAPGVTADMAQMAEAPKAAAEEAAPEATEEYFYYTENSVNYLGGVIKGSAAGAEEDSAAAAPESGAVLRYSAEEIAALRENAYVLFGTSADSYLTGWASEVSDGLYCIDPAKLAALPIGLSLSDEDAARLREDPAPFVYVVAEAAP